MIEEIRKAPDKINPESNEMKGLLSDPEIEDLVLEASAYCNHILEVKDLNSLIYIKYQLGFSFDLVEYLLEYCASLKKTSFDYIEKVARSWFEDGVETRGEAEVYTGETILWDPNIKKTQEQELFIDDKQNERIKKLDIKFAPLFHKIEEVLSREPDSLDREEKNMVYTWLTDFKATPQEIVDACREARKQDKKDIDDINDILKYWKIQQLRFIESKELNEFDFSVFN